MDAAKLFGPGDLQSGRYAALQGVSEEAQKEPFEGRIESCTPSWTINFIRVYWAMSTSTSGPIHPQCSQILKGHSAPVLNVRFTDNGAYCLTTSQDRSLILWHPLKGKFIKRYSKAHNNEVLDVAIYKDHSRFVSCGGDRFAFLWDVTTGNILGKFRGHESKIYSCLLAGNDSLLITGCDDKLVRLFDMKGFSSRGNALQVLNDAKDAISSLVMTGEHRLLVGSIDGHVRIYDLRKGRVYDDDFASPVVLSDLTSNERCYIVNRLDHTVQFVDVDSGQRLNSYHGHKHSNYLINSQLSNDNRYVLSGSEDGGIYVWNLDSDPDSPPIQTLTWSNSSVSEEAMSYKEALALSSIGPIQNAHWGCIYNLRRHPSEAIYLSCHHDKNVRVWTSA